MQALSGSLSQSPRILQVHDLANKTSQRIGIYAGTFDPVHAGHIAFALQAVKAAKLDGLYFLPERQPRNKQGVAHFGHRVAMLRQAIKPHPKFKVLELVDINFNIKQTLPRLRRQFPGDQLVFLFGSDILPSLESWPHATQLLKNSELVIGLRAEDNRDQAHQIVESWRTQPKELIMFTSHAPRVSSGRIRNALRRRKPAPGSLSSVERYSNKHWLYVSLEG